MSQTVRPIEFPTDQADRLEAEAKAMGLSVPAYIEYLKNAAARNHDQRFKDAVGYVFKNYPGTLKKLAQ